MDIKLTLILEYISFIKLSAILAYRNKIEMFYHTGMVTMVKSRLVHVKVD